MVLNREELLKTLELKKETVVLDGGDVIVSEVCAADMMDLYTRKDLQNEAGDITMAKFTPALIAMAVVDEEGKRIFDDSDIPLLEKAAALQFSKLAAVARRLNGLAGDEVKN